LPQTQVLLAVLWQQLYFQLYPQQLLPFISLPFGSIHISVFLSAYLLSILSSVAFFFISSGFLSALSAGVSSFRQLSFQLYPQEFLPFVSFPFSSIRSSFFLSSAFLSTLSAAASSFQLYPQQRLSFTFTFNSIRSSFFLPFISLISALSAAASSFHRPSFQLYPQKLLPFISLPFSSIRRSFFLSSAFL
jgi:hypothetical protein